MSVVDRLKKILSFRKAPASLDSPVSIATVEATVMHHMEAETVQSEPLDAPAPAQQETGATVDDGKINVPLLGTRAAATHQRVLGWVTGLALLALIGMAVVANSQSGAATQQLATAGQALAQAQRLLQSAGQAMAGKAAGFGELGESTALLTQTTQALQHGDSAAGIAALDDPYKSILDAAMPQVAAAEKNAKLLLAQQKAVVIAAGAVKQIQSQSVEMSKTLDALEGLKLSVGAPLPDVAAVYQLKVLLLRIGKASLEALSPQAALPDAALLGRDLGAFQTLAKALAAGSAELRIAPPKEQGVTDLAQTLSEQFEPARVQASKLVETLPVLATARQAFNGVSNDSEPLRRQLETLQLSLSEQLGISGVQTSLMLLAAAIALFSAAGLAYVQVQIVRKRHVTAEAQRLEAQRMEQDAKRVNDANQAAILRLMNELQTVAEGDLTQEATVTEDITGAIADSVNYTVEELRTLVASVQSTASKVAATTAEVDANSTELLAASNEQLHEIRETGRSVVDMAGRINEVSAQAQESARVARQSLEAAQSGLMAVQNTIGGMNAIRDQIQETSKRIKRLGESSQEIGEITELISDITEQTNVLALNAAIQAASAGDAGRGFSVVAEEVQRLAERSADATRQIAALVKTIQTDTQDAIGAMERSTHGVVEGAKLSDNAGTALSEIDRVSRRVADLIEQISNAAAREAGLANEVAENIQHIFAVTEQTGEGTRVTAGQVRELSHMAEELRQSVSRFKIN